MPGTRTTGGSIVRSSSTKERSDPSSSTRVARTLSLPRFQVLSTVKTATPTESGNQPPCATLVRLAPRKARSTVKKTAAPSATSQPGLRHSVRATTRKSRVSTVIVPVTAMP